MLEEIMVEPFASGETSVPAFPANVGRYQLVLPLGVGGAASVFLARATGIGGFSRDVAVKLLHPHLRLDKDYVADFLREARLAARIRHPNVLAVLDVGEDPAGVFLVMDWVDGCSLADLLQHMRASGTAMPLPVAMRIVVDALAGLHAAHETVGDDGQSLGLVHRDVSPHNLLLSAAGEVRLSDFGIAKPTAQAGHTRTGVVKGKLTHMAPEQLRGEALDRRADIWSMGLVAWELIAGKRVFEEQDDAQLIQSVASGIVPSLSNARPELPRDLIHAVNGALYARRDDRWANAEVFRKQLQAAAQQCGGLADAEAVAAFLFEEMGEALEIRRERLRESTPGPIVAPLPFKPTLPQSRKGVVLAIAFGLSVAAAISVAKVVRRNNANALLRPQFVPTSEPASAPLIQPQTAPPVVQLPPAIKAAPPLAKTPKPVREHLPTNKAKAQPPEDVPPLAENPYKKP
jgi:eukaryotic-like serine/threonine-protein kinase